MPKPLTRERGIYLNGSRWWVRSFRSPQSQTTKPISTGTSDLKSANRIAQMCDQLVENRPNWDLLEMVVQGELTLERLYTHFAAGTMHQLRDLRAAEKVAASDVALAASVDEWARHLENVDIQATTRAEYIREVETLTAGLTRTGWTEAEIQKRLHALPVSGSTKRRYIAALKLFYKWAKKRVGLVNVFEDADWIPANNPPRTTFWEFEKVGRVISREMHGEAQAMMYTVFGSGIELGALLAMMAQDVGKSSERTIIARGTKTDFRRERTIFVDQWAWPVVATRAKLMLPRTPLWTLNAKQLREEFYGAQVKAGFVAAPRVNKATGKKLWGEVEGLHTIHDARHSWVLNRLLGLDGEPRQSTKYCAANLGHADEQMVMKVYSKANVEQRLRLLELAEARRIAK
jgi:integrase